jgi:hypothetical protein
VCLVGAGCGSPATHGRDTPRIGLVRGDRWSELTLRPPYFNGRLFNLVLKGKVLSGSVSGGTAPGGALHLKIDEDGAEGEGPLGPVAMDFTSADDATVAEGLWNGQRVYLEFRADSVRGTVADNSGFSARSEAVRRTGRALEPPARDTSCEYFLDHAGSDGALLGGSICSGVPQQTRLEVPAAARTLLTRSELLTVLVTVLSVPPVPASEAAETGNGPQSSFDRW